HALPQEAQMVRARIGVLLDRPFIPREFSLWEGLCYSADLHGVDNPAERILELLDRFRLTWRRRDPVRTFSRGMAQRASLACALLSEPQILILDEPFSGLDPAGCAIVEEAIAETRAAGGTVLLVTHDLERGARLCDEVVVIDRGRLAFRGSGGRWSLEDLTAVYR
ncbi:MAG: ATP-binding cassette domain-containing protein, partial [Planctomycetota bacterium]